MLVARKEGRGVEEVPDIPPPLLLQLQWAGLVGGIQHGHPGFFCGCIDVASSFPGL